MQATPYGGGGTSGFNWAQSGLDPSIFKTNSAWNPDVNSQQGSQIVGGIQQFQQLFQNMMGRAPTTEETQSFLPALNSAWQAPGDLGYSDSTNLANNFISNNFSPQIAQHAQDVQGQQLQKTQQTVQDLVKQQTQAASSDLLDPNGKSYQQFSGLMNNMGITPSSGAFQAGLGGQLGQMAGQAESSALGAVGLPAISQIQGLSGFPMQQMGQNSDLSHLNSLQDFGLQSSLGQMLAKMSQPSGFQTGIGEASSIMQGLGGLGTGAGIAAQGTSYVCKELINRALICESDMDDFHVHIMPAMFKKGRAFWKYAVDGWRLVDAVNEKGLDWKVFKPLLFDRVMEEPDAFKAVDLYADACHQLCISADRTLWDERVMRTSFLDSIPFIPRLLTYPPFMKALWKCVRIKTLIIYDKPRCHHGIR